MLPFLRIILLIFITISSAFAAININTATEQELTALPGIGPSKASAIIEFRTANGPFASVDDLAKVHGIGAKTVDGLRSSASIDNEAPSESPTPPAPKGSGDININAADSNSLQKFNGVGPSTAQKIIDYRNSNGPYSSCNDLIKVKGIGDATLQKIIPDCNVGVDGSE
jgi:competence protein ComEA